MSEPKRAPHHGGTVFAQCIKAHGVQYVFTLTGGHIAPILIGCEALGIRVVDVRDEATAVFAADAVARLTGIPGVAIVTAGPGLTNTITAVKNASMAQSPLLVFGGAAATLLRGRGALQDIDQLELMRPLVKWAVSVSKVSDIVPTITKAFAEASSGVPGPVFVESPLDVIWPRSVVEQEMVSSTSSSSSIFSLNGITDRVLQAYIRHHVSRMFAGLGEPVKCVPIAPRVLQAAPRTVTQAATELLRAARPVLVIGSQTMALPSQVPDIVAAVSSLGIPTYLAGMARGLLGQNHPIQFIHNRGTALKDCDLVILAGLPQDFRLGYGRSISRRAFIISANRSQRDLTLNRSPSLGVLGDPGRFLIDLAETFSTAVRALKTTNELPGNRWSKWLEINREQNNAREKQIDKQANEPSDRFCNPVAVVKVIEEMMSPNAIIVADGGDFVATAAYVVRPRRPLSWLDPGPYGTLGVGGGFAIGAKVARPDGEVWLLYGDGSSAYSIAEFDTYRRHNIPVIAVIGNDAAWMQMYRGQVEFFGSDVATTLEFTDYQDVATAYAGDAAVGFVVREISELRPALQAAKDALKQGKSALVNVLIGKTSFRKGSISV
eukprot:c4823_g1_i1.p1 GENE.c4823_g1_i1~~c4823_g1_i1.p1  ORF type:complete len:618 (-),score=160.70 c4823_g1_i1:19-1836(-)